jgi:hypothetical protein
MFCAEENFGRRMLHNENLDRNEFVLKIVWTQTSDLIWPGQIEVNVASQQKKETNKPTQVFTMIDHFTIFTKGGLVLWSYTQAKLKGTPVDALVRTVLLEERGAENYHNVDQYTLRWSFANEFDLTFVVNGDCDDAK